MTRLIPLKYLLVYPFLPLTIAKLFCLVCSALLLYLFFEKQEFNTERSGCFIAVCHLFAILTVANSLWFTVQKFYWKKLDIGLSAGTFLLYSASIVTVWLCVNPNKRKLYSMYWFILLLQGYLLVATGFSCIWSMFWTSNTVSTLLIPHWGANTADEEIEFFCDST